MPTIRLKNPETEAWVDLKVTKQTIKGMAQRRVEYTIEEIERGGYYND